MNLFYFFSEEVNYIVFGFYKKILGILEQSENFLTVPANKSVYIQYVSYFSLYPNENCSNDFFFQHTQKVYNSFL